MIPSAGRVGLGSEWKLRRVQHAFVVDEPKTTYLGRHLLPAMHGYQGKPDSPGSTTYLPMQRRLVWLPITCYTR